MMCFYESANREQQQTPLLLFLSLVKSSLDWLVNLVLLFADLYQLMAKKIIDIKRLLSDEYGNIEEHSQ